MQEKPKPDPRIAKYVAELEGPIPVISTSHRTLAQLCAEHGAGEVNRLLTAYWQAVRTHDADRNKRLD